MTVCISNVSLYSQLWPGELIQVIATWNFEKPLRICSRGNNRSSFHGLCSFLSIHGLDHTHGHLNRYLFLFKFVTSNRYVNILKGSNKNIELGRERSLSLFGGNK